MTFSRRRQDLMLCEAGQRSYHHHSRRRRDFSTRLYDDSHLKNFVECLRLWVLLQNSMENEMEFNGRVAALLAAAVYVLPQDAQEFQEKLPKGWSKRSSAEDAESGFYCVLTVKVCCTIHNCWGSFGANLPICVVNPVGHINRYRSFELEHSIVFRVSKSMHGMPMS